MQSETRGSSLWPLRRYQWEHQLELGNRNSLAFASDIGSLVVIGRFCDLSITFGGSSGISHRLHGKTDPENHLQPVSFFLSFFSFLTGPIF